MSTQRSQQDANRRPRSESWRSKTCVRLTTHAADQWDNRMPTDSVAPETAFERAVNVSYLTGEIEDEGGQTPEEAWYYYDRDGAKRPYGALFLLQEDDMPGTLPGKMAIVTVYRHGFIWIDGIQEELEQYHDHEFETESKTFHS